MIIKRGMSVLNQLTNKATEKLSPFKTLTTEQENLVDSITEFAAKHLKTTFLRSIQFMVTLERGKVLFYQTSSNDFSNQLVRIRHHHF